MFIIIIIIILWSILKKATGRVFTAEKFYTLPLRAGRGWSRWAA